MKEVTRYNKPLRFVVAGQVPPSESVSEPRGGNSNMKKTGVLVEKNPILGLFCARGLKFFSPSRATNSETTHYLPSYLFQLKVPAVGFLKKVRRAPPSFSYGWPCVILIMMQQRHKDKSSAI